MGIKLLTSSKKHDEDLSIIYRAVLAIFFFFKKRIHSKIIRKFSVNDPKGKTCSQVRNRQNKTKQLAISNYDFMAHIGNIFKSLHQSSVCFTAHSLLPQTTEIQRGNALVFCMKLYT